MRHACLCCTLVLPLLASCGQSAVANASRDRPLALRAVAAPPSAVPMPGGYTTRDPQESEIRQIACWAAAELSGAAWLGDSSVQLVQIVSAASQVVAGTNFKLLLEIQRGNQPRQVRVMVYRDLQNNLSLTRIDLAGSAQTPPPEELPSPNAVPGGYQAIDPQGSLARQCATTALQLLAGPSWLGHAVTLLTITAADTQVVAGTNVYLAMQVQDGTATRHIALVLYRDLSGNSSLSWLRLGALNVRRSLPGP